MSKETYSRSYKDPTADRAIGYVHRERMKNIADSDERFKKVLKSIFIACELGGFKLDNHVVLVDEKTGKKYE